MTGCGTEAEFVVAVVHPQPLRLFRLRLLLRLCVHLFRQATTRGLAQAAAKAVHFCLAHRRVLGA